MQGLWHQAELGDLIGDKVNKGESKVRAMGDGTAPKATCLAPRLPLPPVEIGKS